MQVIDLCFWPFSCRTIRAMLKKTCQNGIDFDDRYTVDSGLFSYSQNCEVCLCFVIANCLWGMDNLYYDIIMNRNGQIGALPLEFLQLNTCVQKTLNSTKNTFYNPLQGVCMRFCVHYLEKALSF